MKRKAKQIQTEKLFRSFTLTRADNEERTAELSFSSEEPYERWFGIEILGHEAEHINMDFIASGRAPLLFGHNHSDLIGVIEKAWIDSTTRTGRATVRFGKGERAEEIFRDVQDGILQNVSVGYLVEEFTITEKKGEIDTYLATRWKPLEVSLVSVPADTTVGVGRNTEDPKREFTTSIITEKNMKDDKTKKPAVVQEPDTPAVKQAAPDTVDVQAIEATASERAVQRVNDIMVLAGRHNLTEEGLTFIKEGKSVDQFKDFVLEKKQTPAADTKPDLPSADIGLSEKDLGNYSVLRAVRAQCAAQGVGDRKWLDEAGFEREVSGAVAAINNQDVRGIMIPTEVLARAAYAVGTPAAAGDLVATNLQGGSFIDALRPASKVLGMGATILADLVGNVDIPKQTGVSTANWLAAEGDDAGEGTGTFGLVQLSPKELAVYADMTRKMLKQTSPTMDILVRQDLINGMGTAMDLACLYGTGSSGQPTGIANTTGINIPTAFAAAAPTFAEVVEMETVINQANADVGSMGYLASATMVGRMKTTEIAANTAQMILAGGEANGYTVEKSNNVATKDLFFGVWSQLLVAMWGGLDVTVDTATLSRSGGLRLVCFQDADLGVRHPEAFSWNDNAHA